MNLLNWNAFLGSMLRVTIDTEQEGGISVNDCEAVSNQLTALFAAEDVDYKRLEVTSPGVERPLKKAKDWIRFAGSLAHVELFAPMFAEGFPEAGRRKLDGRILSVSGEPGSEQIQFEFTGEKPSARRPRRSAVGWRPARADVLMSRQPPLRWNSPSPK